MALSNYLQWFDRMATYELSLFPGGIHSPNNTNEREHEKMMARWVAENPAPNEDDESQESK